MSTLELLLAQCKESIERKIAKNGGKEEGLCLFCRHSSKGCCNLETVQDGNPCRNGNLWESE